LPAIYCKIRESPLCLWKQGSKMTKKILRNIIRKNLDIIPFQTKQEKSTVITEKMEANKLWKTADSIFLFISMNAREPSTFAMIEAALKTDKITAVPRIEPKSGIMTFKKINGLSFPDEVLTEKHPFGFFQPDDHLTDIYPEKLHLNLIIVPGVAFSPDCQRLGNGGGFYDRFLSTLQDNSKTIGICFQDQIIPDLPVEKHDIAVMEVCTEENWYIRPEIKQFLHS